jgi:hypothetical protein
MMNFLSMQLAYFESGLVGRLGWDGENRYFRRHPPLTDGWRFTEYDKQV